MDKTDEEKIISEALDILVTEISKIKITISHDTGDGRLDSAVNEDSVVKNLCNIVASNDYFQDNQLKIGTPNINSNNNRTWYDFSIESKVGSRNDYFFPVNIKITDLDGGGADNLSCKMGIFYTLTGRLPANVNISNSIGWDSFFKSTDAHMAYDKHKDYYFLVIDKRDSSRVFWNSLRSLKSLVENGNNLPFQCVWKDNIDRCERSYCSARHFILIHLKGSIEKREKIGTSFRKYLDKYIYSYESKIANNITGALDE